MEPTADGRYVPRLDGRCTECGLCRKVCPPANENFGPLNEFVFGGMPDHVLIGNHRGCFLAHSADADIRFRATSGGCVTTLLLHLLRSGRIDGAVVTRLSGEDPLRAESFMARSEGEICSAIGSKYLPVPVNAMLRSIRTQPGRFAYVGLPCHIHGLRRAQMAIPALRDKIPFVFGLVCSHVIGKDGVEFVLGKIGVRVEQIQRIQFRGDGWPSGLRIILKDGSERFMPNLHSRWSEIFGGNFFGHFYCTICPDQFAEYADISFADAWIPEVMRTDTVGTSITIPRTERGEHLLNQAASDGLLVKTPIETAKAIRSQTWPILFKKRNIRARMSWLRWFGRKLPEGLSADVSRFPSPTWTDYFVAPTVYRNLAVSKSNIGRRILNWMPYRVLALSRGVYKRLLILNANSLFARACSQGKEKVRIVITNSHGDNRGDEAAQRSMVRTLAELIPQARFTILTNSPKGLSMPEGVEVLPAFAAWNRRFPFFHLPMILLWLGLRKLGLKLSGLNSFPLFRGLSALSLANVVISAPGGPYIGDLYRGHELSEHLLHLWIAQKLGKPVMIYGPSMGPFTKGRNRIRRRLLDSASVITLRDPISKRYLDELGVNQPLVYVAADSAFQDSVLIDPGRLGEILLTEKILDPADRDRPLIGITPAGVRWNFRTVPDSQTKMAEYVALMAQAVDHLVETYRCRVVFFPQLYGRSSDLPLIRSIIEKTHCQDQIRILSNQYDSDIQQAVISRMELMIANRYHSAIFAIKQAVPVVCIAYEHKAKGVMRQAGVEEYLIDIQNLAFEGLIETIGRAWENRPAIRQRLRDALPCLCESARISSLAALALCDGVRRNDLDRGKLADSIKKMAQSSGFAKENPEFP